MRFASTATDSNVTMIMAQIRQLSSVAVLEKISQASKTIERLEDITAIWGDPT